MTSDTLELSLYLAFTVRLWLPLGLAEQQAHLQPLAEHGPCPHEVHLPRAARTLPPELGPDAASSLDLSSRRFQPLRSRDAASNADPAALSTEARAALPPSTDLCGTKRSLMLWLPGSAKLTFRLPQCCHPIRGNSCSQHRPISAHDHTRPHSVESNWPV
jgi:hypothetical protein